MKRKICAITGTRADYGIYHPVLKAIQNTPGLKLQLVATMMHLMKEFGNTIREIEKDGFKITAKVDTSYREDSALAMARSFGQAVMGFSSCFNKLKPDLVLVLGDRGEMLAAVIAANYLNIPVAHIHGGEISGHIDGLLRHAITKLSHLHFPATKKAGQRIRRLGEDPSRVFVCGAPAFDRILNSEFTSREALIRKYRIRPDQPLCLLVQHPVSHESDRAGSQLLETLSAVIRMKLQTIWIYPNADAGGRAIIKVIKKTNRSPVIQVFESLPHRDFLGLMRIASVLVGNSSSGIIEAPSFGLPVVNIGSRQNGRERSSNVIDVNHDRKKIAHALRLALEKNKRRRKNTLQANIYGDGKAGKRIASLLRKVKLGDDFLQKPIF